MVRQKKNTTGGTRIRDGGHVGIDADAAARPPRQRLARARFFIGASGRRGVGASLSTRLVVVFVLAAFLSLSNSGCFETEKGEPFYGRVVAPRVQEFRWSDGGLPRVFDPALAAAPPDTDAVRALFEGLTDYDPRSLEPVAAVATRWESSTDYRHWTFYLRRDARWSNGDHVTAKDFVRSWQRTLRLGERAPHARLLENIEGAQSAVALVVDPSQTTVVSAGEEAAKTTGKSVEEQNATPPPSPSAVQSIPVEPAPTPASNVAAPKFGAEAIDEYVLRVSLRRPDKNFPALVAHPVFRPVHVKATEAEASTEVGQEQTQQPRGAKEETRNENVVSNGAFRLLGRADDSVVLERAGNYWDAGSVGLERVRFIATRDSESALAAYRNGEVDAVTNAAIEPLALKLLAPYKDFRRAIYGALTYYSFNLARAPFNDRRIREALAIALDHDRLSADAMGGATAPARKFLPARTEKSVARAGGEPRPEAASEPVGQRVAAADERVDEPVVPLEHDAERARRLFAEAGFQGGAGFPRIRLLVNRNEQQRVMAQAVAAMWRSVLGVETEIIVRNWDEYEAALWTGDYDIARRSMVMQTTDEESSMIAMFERAPQAAVESDAANAPTTTAAEASASPRSAEDGSVETPAASKSPTPTILTEAQALRELPAIPVYFASSFALVKPYVEGFDTNLLDAPSLKHVRVVTNWKPPAEPQTIRIVSNE